MADWLLPTLADLKVDVMSMLKGREVDAYTLAENPTNPPVGAKRYNHSLNIFQSWNGTAWVNLVVSIAGGGTGASDINGFLDNFNLGSMALQDSNLVTITGGTIAGLTSLHVAGNTHLAGIITAGSAPTTLTNSAGQILETAIADGTILARVGANETISGSWSFVAPPSVNNTGLYLNNSPLKLNVGVAASHLSHISIGESTTSPAIATFFAFEAGISNNHVIVGNNYLSTPLNTTVRINPNLGATYLRLRIAGADINGIDAAGIHIALLKLDPAATYTYAPILQVGNSSAVAELKLAGNANGATLSYRQANVSQANIIGYNQAIYFDSETYLFRNLVGDTLRLSLNGTEANFRVPVRTNSFRNFDGVTTLTFLLNGTNQYFATTHSFYSFNGSVAFANIDASGLTLNQPAAVLSVGGVPGIGMRLYKAGLSAIYTVHQVGGQTQWYDAPGTTHLMTLTSPGKLTANGGFTFPTGTPQNASIQLTGYPDTGFYYSAAGTLEMGTTLATSARSCVRAHYGASKVDIMSGDTVIAVFGPYPAVRFAAHVSPASANTYYCAEPTLSWYTVYTQVAPQITSDIRMKNEHGPITDVLDMVDSIQPFIASFKKELQPVENKYPYWDKKFPSFSAQDILAKIDGKLGTRIVNAELETLSMTNDYLMPIMWQAIRELYARLRVLEGN